MNSTSRVWQLRDGIAAAITGLISFGVYLWSAAPNVTLLDSGEFLVAAQHFGVPHPTGYPLWTFLAWLFQLLPIGNAAWEINVFSGVCSATAVALCAALLSNIQTWCIGRPLTGNLRFLPGVVAVAFSLMLAFSQSVWSQAVIAEVYGLHALLVAVFLILCYSWVRRPTKDHLMLGAFFLLALAFSNHHLILTLAPVPYILILLLRRRAFMDWFFAGILTVLLVYLGFSILSDDQAVRKTALRFAYCVALTFGGFVWLRKGRVRWKLVAYLPIAVVLGLLPYAYMPIASGTNPPMNWGYARDASGFYFSINRSQYSGSLADQSLKSLGRAMGTYLPEAPQTSPDSADPQLGLLTTAQLWIGFFWSRIIIAFTPIALIGYFGSILFVFRMPLDRRVWIYLLHLAFVLAAFAQPLSMDPKIDQGGWWLQMPFHTYTNLIFALLSGLGLSLLINRLASIRPALFWLAPCLLILPAFTFIGSESTANQRNRWFGWQYGHDMLKDLPKNSIVIGGTDAGRFVPTYMIFGESSQPAKFKRDPSFDRRDLYIITQNALGEPNYMKYLRDQYTAERPPVKNTFERWLGREDTYPEPLIEFPTSKEVLEEVKKEVGENADTNPYNNGDRNTVLFGSALKLFWEKNRGKHPFFVEESFPIPWTYDYAVPHGLVYEIKESKVDLTDADVTRDTAFWKDYTAGLLADPNYRKDLDAQRSFSTLRKSIGNIYSHRGMDAQAEHAYREALELWPDNIEVIYLLSDYLWQRGQYDEPMRLFEEAYLRDPNNLSILRLYSGAQLRKSADAEIQKLHQKLEAQPKSADTLRLLIKIHDDIRDTNRVVPLVERALRDFPDDADMMRFLITHYEVTKNLPATLTPAKRLTELESTNVHNHLFLVRAYYVNNDKDAFYTTARKAIELGGQPVRDAFASEAEFAPWRDEPEFQKLLKPSPLAPPGQ